MNNAEEKQRISLRLAYLLSLKGLARPSKMFWYTDIDEMAQEETDEDARSFMVPAYDDSELDSILPPNITVGTREFYKFSHSEYDYHSGQEISKCFYGSSDNDSHPHVITASVKSAVEAKGLMALELLERKIIN